MMVLIYLRRVLGGLRFFVGGPECSGFRLKFFSSKALVANHGGVPHCQETLAFQSENHTMGASRTHHVDSATSRNALMLESMSKDKFWWAFIVGVDFFEVHTRVLAGLRFFVGGPHRVTQLTGHLLADRSPSATNNDKAIVRFMNNRGMAIAFGRLFDGIPQQFDGVFKCLQIWHAAILQAAPQKRRGPFPLIFAGGNA